MKNSIKILLIMIFCGAFMACGQGRSGDGYESAKPEAFANDIKADPTAYILDVRTPQEYAEGHVAGAHNLDWLNETEFMQGAKDLPKARTIYVYCRSGRRSASAANYLSLQGYKVVNLDGGYGSLQRYMVR